MSINFWFKFLIKIVVEEIHRELEIRSSSVWLIFLYPDNWKGERNLGGAKEIRAETGLSWPWERGDFAVNELVRGRNPGDKRGGGGGGGSGKWSRNDNKASSKRCGFAYASTIISRLSREFGRGIGWIRNCCQHSSDSSCS